MLEHATLPSAKPNSWTTPDLMDFKFSSLRQTKQGEWLCSALYYPGILVQLNV